MLADPHHAITAVITAPTVALGVARHVRALRRRDGFATHRTVRRALSERAVRQSGTWTRPELPQPHAALPVTEFGRLLGRCVRPEGGRAVYARWEDIVGIVAPPQTGKTALVGSFVIDAPGPVVATSTKADIYRLTHALRSPRGQVWVFNPEHLAGVASNFAWSPVAGCQDPARAVVMAGYLIGGSGGSEGVEDASFWQSHATRVLRALLYAAAVAGHDLRAVAAWATNSADITPLRILESHRDTPAGWAEALRQIMTTPAARTRESVYLTLATTFEFMADPAVAACTVPTTATPELDLDAFLAEPCPTLYLLGSAREQGGMGPLFAALTGAIFERARALSQATRTGRLDPPLSLVLDEACNICPVPLPQWCADSGGRGIALSYAVQSPSQLEERWGKTGRDTITQATNASLYLGGLRVAGDLTDLADLLGQRDEPTPTPALHRATGRNLPDVRRVDVRSAADLREIRAGHGLLIYRNQRPVEIQIRPVWARRDVAAAQRRTAEATAHYRATGGA